MDYTSNNLKRLIKDESILVIPGEKDSASVIIDKNDYVKKMQEMIYKGIQNVSLYKNRRQHLTRLKSVFTISCT